jgi:hypothetical protein
MQSFPIVPKSKVGFCFFCDLTKVQLQLRPLRPLKGLGLSWC